MALIGDNAIEIEPLEIENFGSLAWLVLAELPTCDEILVRQQLGFALREFCRETDACVVKQPCEAVRVPWNYGFPIVNIPHGMVLGTVLDFDYNGFRSVPFDVHDQPFPHVTMKDMYAHCGDRAVIRYSVYPKAGGEDCPKWFKDRYAEAIVAGAMYHLLSMTGKGWSDPQRAAQYSGKYQQAIAEAAYARQCGGPSSSGSLSAIPSGGGLFM